MDVHIAHEGVSRITSIYRYAKCMMNRYHFAGDVMENTLVSL